MTDPRDLATVFITFCDGVEQAGLVEYARRGRVVARSLLDALDMLDAERSARVALQARCEAQQELLGKHAYEATQQGETA